MAGVSICNDSKHLFKLNDELRLYLKPILKVEILVLFPTKSSGMTISNWEIMEKMKNFIYPKKFTNLKIVKNVKTSQINPVIIPKFGIQQNFNTALEYEFLFLEAEVDNFKDAYFIMDVLNGKLTRIPSQSSDVKFVKTQSHVSLLKISGVNEPLKVRAAYHNHFNDITLSKNFHTPNDYLLISHQKDVVSETLTQINYKDDINFMKESWLRHFNFPSVSTDTSIKQYFDSLKPGFRPDTLNLKKLPTKWFIESNFINEDVSQISHATLYSHIAKNVNKTFEVFGPIKSIDIPYLENSSASFGAFANITAMGNIPLVSVKDLHTVNPVTTLLPLTFDAYVQYEQYNHFERAMFALVGHKLLRSATATIEKDENEIACLGFGESNNSAKNNEYYTALFQCDFDRTQHLSHSSIKRREKERLKRINEEREAQQKQYAQTQEPTSHPTVVKDPNSELSSLLPDKTLERLAFIYNKPAVPSNTQDHQDNEIIDEDPYHRESGYLKPKKHKKNTSKSARKRKRAEHEREAEVKAYMAKVEERKLLLSQRKLESVRLLNFLFRSIDGKLEEKERRQALEEKRAREAKARKDAKEAKQKEILLQEERSLRQKLVKKFARKTNRDIEKIVKTQ